MYVPDIELHEACTLEEAVAVMQRHRPGVRMLAGGTDLLVDLKTGRVRIDHVVSINRIEALHGLSTNGDGLRIGSLTTIAQLGASPIVKERFSPLLDATSKMANPQVRNTATAGGNIVSAVPCADLPPILTAMNASLVLWSPAGEREVALENFFVGPRETILRDDEVLAAILVPTPAVRFGAAYARFGLRGGNTVSVAAVAASLLLDGKGNIEDARIVLGAVAPIPKLVEEVGAALVGQTPGEEAFRNAGEIAMAGAEPISDVRGSSEYRRELVGVLTERALTTALQRAQEKR